MAVRISFGKIIWKVFLEVEQAGFLVYKRTDQQRAVQTLRTSDPSICSTRVCLHLEQKNRHNCMLVTQNLMSAVEGSFFAATRRRARFIGRLDKHPTTVQNKCSLRHFASEASGAIPGFMHLAQGHVDLRCAGSGIGPWPPSDASAPWHPLFFPLRDLVFVWRHFKRLSCFECGEKLESFWCHERSLRRF